MQSPERQSVIILCGGRGRRLGSLSDRLPKALTPVRGKPILWHTLLRLHMNGFRHFILPLGYKGEDIAAFIDQEFSGLDARIEAIDTGEQTPIGKRISTVRPAIEGDSLLLVNGDTVFDFDAAATVRKHRQSGMELTLTSCRIISNFGLLLTDSDGRLMDFARNCPVSEFMVSRQGGDKMRAFINAGITVLNTATLDTPGIANADSFEQHLYPQIVAAGRARHEHINGFWYAVDTQKDLEIANGDPAKDSRSAGTDKLAKKLFDYARSRALPV